MSNGGQVGSRGTDVTPPSGDPLKDPLLGTDVQNAIRTLGVGAYPAKPFFGFTRAIPWYQGPTLYYIGSAWGGMTFYVPGFTVEPHLVLGYDASRGKAEVVNFSLVADCQSVITDVAGADVATISIASQNVASPIDPGGALPIGAPSAAVYFAGPRGDQSLEYLICLARAQLRIRSRAAIVEFQISFALGVSLNLSCRKSVTILDARLPGGQATGKIIEYELSFDGDTGANACKIRIGCAIGHGGTVEPAEGTPSYVEDGYVNDGYIRRDGAFVMPIDGEVAYESLSGLAPTDDGIDFNRMTANRCVLSITKTNPRLDQYYALARTDQEKATWADPGEPSSPGTILGWCNEKQTTIDIAMVPLDGGPFTTNFSPNVDLLPIPKLINLEASS